VTPIVVNGVMYLPSGNRVVALEPETGKEIWRYELPEGLASFRGVAYWPGDGRLPARILFTSLKKLFALRADNGQIDFDFGNGGHVDLEIAYSGVPAIYKNTILMGSNFFGPGERHIGLHLEKAMGEKGDVPRIRRAQRAEGVGLPHDSRFLVNPVHDTWQNDSWRGRTGNNVWSFTLTWTSSAASVYMPVSGPGMNYYGGDRPGTTCSATPPVALDAQTGKLKVALPEHPTRAVGLQPPPRAGLIDIRKDGRTIPALAQVGKSGFMFILNRETGRPIFGVDERPQAKADVPERVVSRRRSRSRRSPGRLPA
jgi:quinoprotein glucose dehydrogenase